MLAYAVMDRHVCIFLLVHANEYTYKHVHANTFKRVHVREFSDMFLNVPDACMCLHAFKCTCVYMCLERT